MANYVTFFHRRFTLKGGMTTDFKETVTKSSPLTASSIHVLSCKEAGSGKEVLAWSKDANWESFNWAGATVKLVCDGWVNEFIVEDSGAEPKRVYLDKVTFDVVYAASMTVEKRVNAGYPENGKEYLNGLALDLLRPVDTFGETYPFFRSPGNEVIKAYETYTATLEGDYPDCYLYHMGVSVNDKGECTYSFKDGLCEGKYDEYGLPDADILSKNCGCPRSRYLLRSVAL